MKNEKGAITFITLGTIIFIIAFLVSSFVIISNKLQAQTEIKRETKRIYEAEVNNVDQIYDNLLAVDFVEYIQGTGTQYIDTGILPDNNTTFEISIALDDITSTQAIFGSRQGIGQQSFNVFFNDKDMRWDYNTTQTSSGLTYTIGQMITITKNTTSTIIETKKKTKTIANATTTFSNPYSLYIFNIQQSGTAETRLAKMKLYYFKVYKNGTLVGDFVPAIDKNNVACLYDKVTKQCLYNSGTGNFNYK